LCFHFFTSVNLVIFKRQQKSWASTISDAHELKRRSGIKTNGIRRRATKYGGRP
jgi:hypothetical protein